MCLNQVHIMLVTPPKIKIQFSVDNSEIVRKRISVDIKTC
jgi:hypothetical protein